MATFALAATVHDPAGAMATAITRLTRPLRETFAMMAFNISDATHPVVHEALASLGGRILVHAAGEAMIGKARRDAVALAGEDQPALYSDLDHLLRWIEFGPDDLKRALAHQPDLDVLVIGRSARAMVAEPRRLRETEALVNHIHFLVTGDHWDLMFAVRRLSPKAIRLILAKSRIDTLANDVEWPLLAREAGLGLGYMESDALFYRTIEEFGQDEDTNDADPLQWVRRLEFAAQHASAMRPFLRSR